jgi:Sporulation and spore germination.
MKQKWLKNGVFLTMCALLTFVYFETKETPKVDKEVVVTDFDGYRQVVYMDQDRLLIPVTYAVNETQDLKSEVQEIFTLMQDPGNLKNTLRSIIPQQTTLLDASIDENGILNLNLSAGIENLASVDELRFLEATSYVFCQLDGVNGVSYLKEGQPITCMPNGKITLQGPLNKTLGINNFETSNGILHHTEPMLVFFAKTIEGEEFYVPVSKRVATDASLDDKLNDIIGEVSVTSTLSQASPLEALELLDGSNLEDGHLSVNLNAMALLDERTLDDDVYDLLVLSFSSMNGVDNISIQVQGQDIEMPQAQKVSEIVYNVVKI